MQLFILDKSPIESAMKLPLKIGKYNYASKMLVELGQLLSSTIIEDGYEYNEEIYKYIPQGKELRKFIRDNKGWILAYYKRLYHYCKAGYTWDNSKQTLVMARNIYHIFRRFYAFRGADYITPCQAVFRYKENYPTNIPTKTVLPIEECISEYTKYIDWKRNGN